MNLRLGNGTLTIQVIINMEYCYHILAGVPDHYLDMLEKIQKQVHFATAPKFADFLALQKMILMWSVLVSSVATLLEDANLSQLNDI